MTESGKKVCWSIKGRDGYFETARMAVEAALAMSESGDELRSGSESVRGGVLTPGIAGKHVLFDRIRKAGMGFIDWSPGRRGTAPSPMIDSASTCGATRRRRRPSPMFPLPLPKSLPPVTSRPPCRMASRRRRRGDRPPRHARLQPWRSAAHPIDATALPSWETLARPRHVHPTFVETSNAPVHLGQSAQRPTFQQRQVAHGHVARASHDVHEDGPLEPGQDPCREHVI